MDQAWEAICAEVTQNMIYKTAIRAYTKILWSSRQPFLRISNESHDDKNNNNNNNAYIGEEMLYLHMVSSVSNVFLNFSRDLNHELYSEHTKPNSITSIAKRH